MNKSSQRQYLLQAFGRYCGITLDVCLCLNKHIKFDTYQEATKCVQDLVLDSLLQEKQRDQRLKPLYFISSSGSSLVGPLSPLTQYEVVALEKFQTCELTRAFLQEKIVHLLQNSLYFLTTLQISDELRVSIPNTISLLAELLQRKEIQTEYDLWFLA